MMCGLSSLNHTFGSACALCSFYFVLCSGFLCCFLHVLCVAFRAGGSPLRGLSLASLAVRASLSCLSEEKFLKLSCQQQRFQTVDFNKTQVLRLVSRLGPSITRQTNSIIIEIKKWLMNQVVISLSNYLFHLLIS